MSSIKIPTLDLFKNNRPKRQHYEQVQINSQALVRKGRHRQVLEQIKTSHYVQTYKNNLKHFVSPSKYRDKAQEWISSQAKHQNYTYRALAFPTSRYRCPHCFHQTHQCREQEKRCYCELGPQTAAIKRVRSAQRVGVEPERRTVRQKRRQIQQIKEIRHSIGQQNTRIDVYSYNIHHQPPSYQVEQRQKRQGQKRQREHQNQPKIPYEPQHGPQSEQPVYPSFGNLNSKSEHQGQLLGHDKMQKHLEFIQHLAQCNDKLNNIELSPQSSSTLQIDISSLIQAKKSYVTKSKQILHSLDAILNKYQ